ncbi:MAG: hypothetical protein ACKPKO_50965, partial [Candidatus Fonsibacter sp.]
MSVKYALFWNPSRAWSIIASQYLISLLGYVDVFATSCSACPMLDFDANGKDAGHVNYHLVFTLSSMRFLYSANPRTSSHYPNVHPAL